MEEWPIRPEMSDDNRSCMPESPDLSTSSAVPVGSQRLHSSRRTKCATPDSLSAITGDHPSTDSRRFGKISM